MLMKRPILSKSETAMPDRPTHVEFDNVQKTYDGETLVVKSLDLSIGQGEFLTMLGPSGSGKTTCLMMLAGFESVTRGQIRIGGRSVTAIPAYQRGIGMVFQNYALFPHLSVGDNLAFPLRARRMGKAEVEDKVSRALDMVQMGAFADRFPGQLSGGQQQRVALARALVFEPSLVLMDEPLGALDKNLREHMQFEIKALHERIGVTVVYVTHDQTEAMTMSDRVAVFEDGRIQQLAPPRQLYEQPENRFVAQFIGENNEIEGRITGARDGLVEVTLAGGETVTALAVGTPEVGAITHLSIRPERVSIRPEASEGPTGITGIVKDLSYLGDQLRYRIRSASAEDFVVKVPNAGQSGEAARGDTVHLSWAAEDGRAL